MIDIKDLLKRTGAKSSDIQAKKEQTSKKIEYVSKYVEKWLRVGVNSNKIKKLVFIDCMSNAGIYADGELSTATRVFSLFCREAKIHPEKEFLFVINDINEKRVALCKEVCRILAVQSDCYDNPDNLTVVSSARDVNAFVDFLAGYRNKIDGYGILTLLFVDPYDARTVDVSALKRYLETRYCELFFNWFSSDRTRNRNDQAIRNCFSGVEIPEKTDVSRWVAEYLKGEQVKYSFCYPFRNMNNTELYQIIFLSPNVRGLEKVKEALWDVFSGREYHKNDRGEGHQTTLFELDGAQDFLLQDYSNHAITALIELYSGKEVSYKEIELCILQQSMLREKDILKWVVKPLIREGLIVKLNKGVSANNYKKDRYLFIERSE